MVEWTLVFGLILMLGFAVYKFVRAREEVIELSAKVVWKNDTIQGLRDVHSADIKALHTHQVEVTSRYQEEIRRLTHELNTTRKHLLDRVTEMASRMASLKLQPQDGVVVTEDPLLVGHAYDDTLPYSAELFEFLNKIESEDARVDTEVWIDSQRPTMTDEDILTKLKQGDY